MKNNLRILNYKFTIEELEALYSILERTYIDYHNENANAVVDRIGRIIRENNIGMARGTGQST